MEQSDQQRTLVTYDLRRHLLMIAAPGSGKTHTITERIAYQIDRHTLNPEQTLVMTFTNMAADELLRRLQVRLGAHAEGMWIRTFHSLCIRWLRAEGSAIGVAPSFVVLDTVAQQRVLRRAIERAGVVLSHHVRGHDACEGTALRYLGEERRRQQDNLQPLPRRHSRSTPSYSTPASETITPEHNDR